MTIKPLDDLTDQNYDDGPPPLDLVSEVDALVGADRHLRHVARLRLEIDTLEQVYAAEFARIEDRLIERRTLLQKRIDWHLAPVRQLHERLVETDPTRKTIELPHGALRMRTPSKPKVFIDDQASLIEWAEESAPDLLPPVTRINVTDVRNATDIVMSNGETKVVLRATGELVPHVSINTPPSTWAADTTPTGAF